MCSALLFVLVGQRTAWLENESPSSILWVTSNGRAAVGVMPQLDFLNVGHSKFGYRTF